MSRGMRLSTKSSKRQLFKDEGDDDDDTVVVVTVAVKAFSNLKH